MEYPPNTVPITAEEFKQLPDGTPFYYLQYKNGDYEKWVLCWRLPVNNGLVVEVRIRAHDYRHYFGEVVDLKEYAAVEGKQSYLEYLGNNFHIDHWAGIYSITKDEEFFVKGELAECQQWLCDHFTALFKKDRPHDNIRFIWS